MTEKKTRTPANTVLLMRKTDEGDLELVQSFRVGGENKVPLRAVRTFLATVSGDTKHELHGDLMEGRLVLLSGHEKAVSVGNVTAISI